MTMVTPRREASTEPPSFVGLVAHPLRWRLLCELARSDRAVGELMALTQRPQNLVSYHLRRLRDDGLVAARRSSADGRAQYYSIDLGRCRERFESAGVAIHPALATVSVPVDPPIVGDAPPRQRVLFLCTGNSARSQMAEALVRHLSGGAIEAVSAGSHPKPLHPTAVRVMRRRGIDIGGQQSKHLDVFVSDRFDRVITLCDVVREVCPSFPSHPQLVHWSMANPAIEGLTARATTAEFERTAADLESRIRYLLLTFEPVPPRSSSHVR